MPKVLVSVAAKGEARARVVDGLGRALASPISSPGHFYAAGSERSNLFKRGRRHISGSDGAETRDRRQDR